MLIHIICVSEQPLPNLLPCLENTIKPDKVVALCSKNMLSPSKNRYLSTVTVLSNAMQHLGIKIDVQEIDDINDFMSISQAAETIINKNVEHTIIGNLTGGTKLMSLGLYYACTNNNLSAFYINGNKVIEVEKGASGLCLPPTIKQAIDIKLMLGAHGFQLLESEHKAVSHYHRLIAKRLVSNVHSHKIYLPSLNALASDAKYNNRLESNYKGKKAEEFKNFITHISYHENGPNEELITFKPSYGQLKFKDEDARTFFNGAWLEELIFSALSVLKKESDLNITYVGRSVKVRPFRQNENVSQQPAKINNDYTDNELDVVALINNQLWVFEAKTQKASFDKNSDKNWINKALYKLAALNKNLGGLRTTPVIVSFSDVDDVARTRANTFDIKILAANDIQNIKSSISKMIRSQT